MAKGNVEVWLGELLREQMRSLHGVIRDAWRAITSEFELLNFLNNFPAQVGPELANVLSARTHSIYCLIYFFFCCDIVCLFHEYY